MLRPFILEQKKPIYGIPHQQTGFVWSCWTQTIGEKYEADLERRDATIVILLYLWMSPARRTDLLCKFHLQRNDDRSAYPKAAESETISICIDEKSVAASQEVRKK